MKDFSSNCVGPHPHTTWPMAIPSGWQFRLCVCVLCGGGVPTLVRRVREHFGTVPGRVCAVCGLGGVDFEVLGTFCTLLKVPEGITVYVVRFYGVLDRS